MSCFLVYSLEKAFSTSCKLTLFSIMVFRLLLSVSIILCQIDRFLSLYLHAEYNNYFDDCVALNVCILRWDFSLNSFQEDWHLYTLIFFSIIICLIISMFTSAIDHDIFYCDRSLHFFLSTHRVNIWFSAIPKCVAALLVIFVSLYVLVIWKRTLNNVIPINLPVPEQQLSER